MANDGKNGEVTSDQALARKTVVQGEWVFEEGNKADAAYLVLEGRVEIFRGEGTKQTSIATLGRGEIFGELSLIDGKSRTASARATKETQLMIIKPEDLESRMDQLEKADKVLFRLINIFVARLRGQHTHSF